MTRYIDKDQVIEWIKQRLIPTVTNGNYDDWERGADNERINFLSFINSLPEESTDKTMKKNYHERYKRIAQTEQFKKSYCDKSLGKEEPTVKGITWKDVNTLESLIYQVHNEYPSIGEKSFGLEVLERFQDYQDDIEEHNEDLEEEIDRYWEGWIDPDPEVKGVDGYLSKDEFSVYACHFAEWQKKQMMKNAVDATILDIDAQTIEFGLWPEKLLDIKEGDKVKIIIIKEN